jgi:Flp pilus assembly protein CpaB
VKRSNRLVILVGVLLAVLAFVAIVILLNQRDTDTPVTENTETVLVATVDIEIGEEVTAEMAREEQVQPGAVQGNALSDISILAGQPALRRIPARSQIPGEAIGIGDPVVFDLPELLNPGEKAVSFQVERVGGLNFLVKEGDTIDILIHAEITVVQATQDSAESEDPDALRRIEPVPGLEKVRSIKVILQDKRVIYVSATRATAPELVDSDGDGTPDEDQPEQPVFDSVVIVFAGSAQDAEVLRLAQAHDQEIGSLSVVVRHADDDEIEETLGITIEQLVENYGLRIPGIIELLEEEEVPAP